MKDWDEHRLKQLAHAGITGLHNGVECVPVPLDLLLRVVSHFDCDHVQRELTGGRSRPA